MSFEFVHVSILTLIVCEVPGHFATVKESLWFDLIWEKRPSPSPRPKVLAI